MVRARRQTASVLRAGTRHRLSPAAAELPPSSSKLPPSNGTRSVAAALSAGPSGRNAERKKQSGVKFAGRGGGGWLAAAAAAAADRPEGVSLSCCLLRRQRRRQRQCTSGGRSATTAHTPSLGTMSVVSNDDDVWQGAGGGGSSRPVSALSEEPLPPLSVRGSSDDLRSAGASSVYHSTESLAVSERVTSVSPAASSSTGTVERRPSTRASTASPAVAEDELPPEGTVRSAVQKMQQLSRSAEELARRPRTATDAADGRSTLSASPSVPMSTATPTPPPPPVVTAPEQEQEQEQDAEEPCEQLEAEEEVRRSPLYVHVEQEDDTPPPADEPAGERGGNTDLEQRPSPDGRESLASPGSSDLPPQLPSVKELRNHFQAGGAPPTPQKQVRGLRPLGCGKVRDGGGSW